MNIFDAFSRLNKGEMVRDSEGVLYKKSNDKLVESFDEGVSWSETQEFTFGTINGKWAAE